MSFSLLNKTRGATPAIPFGKIKDQVLGKDYDLSLALLQPAQARRVTRETKHKDKASNVLSFPLSKNSGEIFLCPATARAQAHEYGYKNGELFLAHLFIHGLLHLKGYAHSDMMDNEEDKVAQRFGY